MSEENKIEESSQLADGSLQNINEKVLVSAPVADTEQPQTINDKPQTKDMEVHHHSHQGHEKKNWKSYFWEFLMLFLAVFCGFLAENIREQYIERHKEKEYMNSLYQDLKADTLNMSTLIKSTMADIANYDSVFNIFKSKEYLKETSNVYYFGRKLVTLRPFYPTDGTINQLENSGGLRLIRNRAIVDSIQSYKLAVSYLKSVQDFEREHFVLARSLMGKIFDADVFDKMMGDSSNPLQRPDKNYPLMPFTAAELNDFHIPLNFIKRNKITQTVLIKRLQKKASDLMKLLQDKYKVDQE
jgi:hypothetical protein